MIIMIIIIIIIIKIFFFHWCKLNFQYLKLNKSTLDVHFKLLISQKYFFAHRKVEVSVV